MSKINVFLNAVCALTAAEKEMLDWYEAKRLKALTKPLGARKGYDTSTLVSELVVRSMAEQATALEELEGLEPVGSRPGKRITSIKEIDERAEKAGRLLEERENVQQVVVPVKGKKAEVVNSVNHLTQEECAWRAEADREEKKEVAVAMKRVNGEAKVSMADKLRMALGQ